MELAKSLVIIMVVATWSHTTYSGTYTWKDENGQMHFSDTPPESGEFDQMQIKTNSYTSTFIQSLPKSTGISSEKVVMYGTSWCGYCKRARAYFEKNHIAYVEYNIEKSKKAKKEYDKLNGRGVPLIVFRDKTLRGFSVSAFENIYQ